MLAPHWRDASLVLALAASSSFLFAQSPADRGRWAIDLNGQPRLLDELNLVARTRGDVQFGLAPRRALDGALWGLSSTLTGVVRVREGQPPRSVDLAGLISEVVVDSASHALVLAGARVLEFAPDLQPVGNWLLSQPGQALEVGADGNVWIGLANQPAPLLERLDRSSGSRQLIPLPASVRRVIDVLPDGRAGGDHVFVGGFGGEVIEVDSSTNRIVARHALPGAGVDDGLRQLELAPDGSVWALGVVGGTQTGVWRIDVASGTVDQLVGAGLRGRAVALGMTLDAEGRAWLHFGGDSLQLAADGAVLNQTVGRALTNAEDAGGTYLLRVLGPDGDQDADQSRNADELAAGSDAFDDQSWPGFDLDVATDAPVGGSLDMDLRMPSGLALIAIGQLDRTAVPVRLPGLGGELRIGTGTMASDLLTFLQATPSRLQFPIPASAMGSGDLVVQAVSVPGFGNPGQFSEVGVVKFRQRRITSVSEGFAFDLQRDELRSGGLWIRGKATAGRIGGVGVLGSFDFTLGRQVDTDVWEFSTDDQLFPAGATLFGDPIRVTDGVFEFTDFVVPAGITVRFVGSNPVVLRVRGGIVIDGVLDVSGADAPEEGFSGVATSGGPTGWIPATGQPGAPGGPGAGAGGAGADGCELDGDPTGHSGAAGESVRPLAGSGYAGLPGLAATGGNGASVFPTSARQADVTFNFFSTISAMVGAGGGGGAWQGAGDPGQALSTFQNVPSDLGPDSVGGTPLGYLLPAPRTTSLGHFLVGGAGGGGGGSHPVNMSVNSIRSGEPMRAGAGGGGGGGAVALRVGGELQVGAGGVIQARGGAGARDLISSDQGPPTPGGGGSGGSVLIQADYDVPGALGGLIDVRGGIGGLLRNQGFSGALNQAEGGTGGHGLVRLEMGTNTPSVGTLGNVEPAAAIVNDARAPLVDTDRYSGQQSRFYPLAAVGEPSRLLRYELRVRVNGGLRIYTDDPAAYNPANLPGQPLRFLVQGARVGANGEVVETGAWRDQFAGPGGIAGDGTVDAVRFMLLFDRSVATDTEVVGVTFEFAQ